MQHGPDPSTVMVFTQSVDIPLFSGKDPALLESWIFGVEAKVRGKGTAVTDADYISMAMSTLDYTTGDAYLLAGSHDLKKIENWDEFKTFYRRRYSSAVDRDPFGIARQIVNAVMRPDETRNAFASRLDMLQSSLKSALTGSRWEDNGSLTIDNVCKLLTFGALQRHAPEAILNDIEAKEFGPNNTIWDLMDAMIDSTERLKNRDSAVFIANSPHNPVNIVARSLPSNVQTHARFPPPSYGPRSDSRTGSPQYPPRPRTPECFNCGEPGHRKAECTTTNTRYQQHARHNNTGHTNYHNRPYCTFHHRPGHDTSECHAGRPPFCTYHQLPGHDTTDCRACHNTNQANRYSPAPLAYKQSHAATPNQR
ncbi:uncharacterized protein [Procambarus clarkii]|uniref:uncharacterized protein n=1 Tax=Procambarus clarkii TaxID=6728 RepID=UPI0037422DD1